MILRKKNALIAIPIVAAGMLGSVEASNVDKQDEHGGLHYPRALEEKRITFNVTRGNIFVPEEDAEEYRGMEDKLRGTWIKEATLEKKIDFLIRYFELKSDIYEYNQSEVRKHQDMKAIQKILASLSLENELSERNKTIISETIREVQNINKDEHSEEAINSLSEKTKILLDSYIATRESGRILFQTIMLEMDRVAKNNGERGAIEVAIEAQTEGKTPYILNGEVLIPDKPLEKENNSLYIELGELGKLSDVEIKESDSEITLLSNARSIKINKNTGEVFIGENRIASTGMSREFHGAFYLPIRAVFEIFNYEVLWNTDSSIASIEKNVFKKESLDTLDVDSFVDGLFQ